MRLLRRRHFDRMADFGDENRMGSDRFVGKPQRFQSRAPVAFVERPSGNSADREQRQRAGDLRQWPQSRRRGAAIAPGREPQPVGHRLIQHRIECGREAGLVAPVRGEPFAQVGRVRQHRLDAAARTLIEFAIKIGVKLFVADFGVRRGHLTVLRAGRPEISSPSISRRKRSRPRDRRDMTVPFAVPVMRAASA